MRAVRHLAVLLCVSGPSVCRAAQSFAPPPPPELTTLAVMALLACVLLAVLVALLIWRLRSEVALRRQVDASAQEERSRLNAILNNSGVGVLLADRNVRLVDVNRRWCRMFGHRRHEVRGKVSIRDVVLAEQADAMVEHFRAMLAGKSRSDTRESRFVRKDGTVFWGLISTSTVLDKQRKRKWVVGIIADIEQQKATEQALRESEERLRFITESTHDVVWQFDSELRVTYVNGADERMRGYKREDVIGREFKEIISPAASRVVDQLMASRAAQPYGTSASDVRSFDVEMGCRDGRRLWAEINFTLIRDRAGRVVGYIGVARDATLRREDHAKLREQTIRDSLTGLFNRRYLDESLRRELSRAIRDSLPLALVMIDIDHFKRLNDTHGHQAGDAMLTCLGRLVSQGARSADLPCRYGGEEFLVVLPNMTAEVAAERAEQWRLAFAAERLEFEGRVVLSATFSAGVSAFPACGKSLEGLVRAADQALYAAKNAGRNNVVIASPREEPTGDHCA